MVRQPKIDLSKISSAPTAPDDERVESEIEYFDRIHQRKMQGLERESFRQNVAERKKYAKCIYWMVCCWLAGVWVLLIFSSLLKISDSVLIAIVSGTTVDVLGLFVIVANYLFPKEAVSVKRKR